MYATVLFSSIDICARFHDYVPIVYFVFPPILLPLPVARVAGTVMTTTMGYYHLVVRSVVVVVVALWWMYT